MSPTMPSGLWKPEMTPRADSLRLALAGQELDPTPADRSASRMKSRHLRHRARRRGQHMQLPHSHRVAQRAKAAQRRQRLCDAAGIEVAGRLHRAAEAAHRLLVEDRRRAAGQPLIDDEADRVRPDIDGRDRRALADPALREVGIGRGSRAQAPLRVRRLFGDECLRDFPRPDRLGLVMKYWCALNGSSPLAGTMRLRRTIGQDPPALLGCR